MNTLCTASNLC